MTVNARSTDCGEATYDHEAVLLQTCLMEIDRNGFDEMQRHTREHSRYPAHAYRITELDSERTTGRPSMTPTYDLQSKVTFDG